MARMPPTQSYKVLWYSLHRDCICFEFSVIDSEFFIDSMMILKMYRPPSDFSRRWNFKNFDQIQ